MSKVYGHFCQILAFFMMPAHQIWSCHVTQEANFEKLLSCPNSASNIRKSHKISSRKPFYFRSYQPKTSRGVENTPPSVLLGLKQEYRDGTDCFNNEQYAISLSCWHASLLQWKLTILKVISL